MNEYHTNLISLFNTTTVISPFCGLFQKLVVCIISGPWNRNSEVLFPNRICISLAVQGDTLLIFIVTTITYCSGFDFLVNSSYSSFDSSSPLSLSRPSYRLRGHELRLSLTSTHKRAVVFRPRCLRWRHSNVFP